ncbi:MAG: MerR family transcriptional regulator [Candidatus Marinimicrobia bacterium]|nr:MerR family transcriptional regulator [Candidatus Neomarinimicrobiota bacterium]MDP6852399.1 MerR family transcriptional regulator [Candidatus Neomarinimicrobiota bacterium]
MEAREFKKLYYSISEVSEVTGLKQYVLRYWETEFSQLKPTKNRAGNRTYRSSDIDLIMEIKSLLYERKFTIKGAKQYLKEPPKQQAVNKTISANKIIKISNKMDLDTLKDMRKGLGELIKIIEQFKD